MRTRSGTTLIELLVVLAILSLMAGAVTMTLRVANRAAPNDGDRVLAAKREAIATGQPVRLLLRGAEQAMMVTALPDGRVIRPHAVRQDSSARERDDATR